MAMCYYHVIAALNEQLGKLPRGRLDKGAMLWDVQRLADTPPELFPVAWAAVRRQWEERGWTAFLAYFEASWIDKLAGWSVGYLGVGLPRTNGGLEGSWPLSHRHLNGRRSPEALLLFLCITIIPYYVKNISDKKKKAANRLINPLSLLEKQEAYVLSTQASDVLRRRVIAGEEFFFCHKRILGQGRPTISEHEIDEYLSISQRAEGEWSPSEFAPFHPHV